MYIINEYFRIKLITIILNISYGIDKIIIAD